MITVEQARKDLTTHVSRGAVTTIPLGSSVGHVIAVDLEAPHDMPRFTASAMDGYALRHAETIAASRAAPVIFRVVGCVCAGEKSGPCVQSGEAVQIMTGAMMPAGVTAVVPKEAIQQMSADFVQVVAPVEPGAHVRRQGEEMTRGARALQAGTAMTPGGIGFVASMGIYAVPVFAAPRVHIVPTGSELVRDDERLQPGKIFESNSYALSAACTRLGLTPVVFPPIADRTDHLGAALHECLAQGDVTIISGGVSVGEKDYVREVLQALDVTPVFWEVAQKPGKPLFLGKRGRHVVFGLPGNPAASLVCFYEYVQPALRQWMGYARVWPDATWARLTTPIRKQPGRTHFLRAVAIYDRNILQVTPMSMQASHCMGAFAQANCLAVVPADVASCDVGDSLDIHWLDDGRLS